MKHLRLIVGVRYCRDHFHAIVDLDGDVLILQTMFPTYAAAAAKARELGADAKARIAEAGGTVIEPSLS